MLDNFTRLFRKNKTADEKHIIQPAVNLEAEKIRLLQQTEQQARAAHELESNPSQEVAARIAQGKHSIELRCQALAILNDTQLLRQIALNDKVAQIRLAAGMRLTSTDDLEVLRRDSKDKSVQRHARHVLKALREQEYATEETRKRITHLLNAIDQHAKRDYEPLHEAKLVALQTAWQEVASCASAMEQEHFAESAGLARHTINRHEESIRKRSAIDSAKQELIAACDELTLVANRLKTEDLTNSVAAIAALRSTQQTRWEEATFLLGHDNMPATQEKQYKLAIKLIDSWLSSISTLPRIEADAANFLTAIAENKTPDTATLEHWQHLLDTLHDHIEWPSELMQPPLLAELALAEKQLQAIQQSNNEDIRSQIMHLRKRRHALKVMIDEGQLRTANKTYQWLSKRINALPKTDADRERGAMAPIEEALKKLHDWYEFSSTPKKVALCERIEALSLEAPDINARADHIRTLREQWNTLCAANPEADPELRARFDRAATIAFAPCAAWYAQQRLIQDKNLQARQALCDALSAELKTTETNPPNTTAAWKMLEQRERDARAQWKMHEPVRWPEAQPTQIQFTTLIAELRTQLDAERDSNANKKKTYITTATELLTKEPINTAIEEVKKLQLRWKEIGHTDPREDHLLWKNFRSAVDAVFARRQAAREADDLARKAEIKEAMARKTAEEENKLRRTQAVIELRKTAYETAHLLAIAESLWLAGNPFDANALEITTLQANINTLEKKNSLTSALRLRMDNMLSDLMPTDAELEINTAQLQQLTLDLEILLDIPSPPALAQARMERKLAKLSAALQGARQIHHDKEMLEDAWLAPGPIRAEARAPLLARFQAMQGR